MWISNLLLSEYEVSLKMKEEFEKQYEYDECWVGILQKSDQPMV